MREDFAVAVAVVMLGMLVDARRRPRAAIVRTLVYGLAALATVTPFVVYASLREHRFTPIVSAGPNALFLGTYLPGGGNQFFDIEALSKQVCAHFRHTPSALLPPLRRGRARRRGAADGAASRRL